VYHEGSELLEGLSLNIWALNACSPLRVQFKIEGVAKGVRCVAALHLSLGFPRLFFVNYLIPVIAAPICEQ